MSRTRGRLGSSRPVRWDTTCQACSRPTTGRPSRPEMLLRTSSGRLSLDRYAQREAEAVALINALGNVTGGPVTASDECQGQGGDFANCPATGLPSERGLKPDALRALRCTKRQFPAITNIGGFYQSNSGEHPLYRAIDIMIPDVRECRGKTPGHRDRGVAEGELAPVRDHVRDLAGADLVGGAGRRGLAAMWRRVGLLLQRAGRFGGAPQPCPRLGVRQQGSPRHGRRRRQVGPADDPELLHRPRRLRVRRQRVLGVRRPHRAGHVDQRGRRRSSRWPTGR